MHTSLHLIIDRFEGRFAVLNGDDGLEINWPKRNLPKGAKEGDSIVLSAVTNEEDRKKREKTAKEILNEILKISS